MTRRVGGVSTGSVTEDVAVTEEGDLTTQGSLTIADPDSGQAAFAAQASVAGTYGTFTLDAAGNWTYTADNSQQAIQQLGANQSITDSFTAVSADGTDSQVITVTIHGSNDGAEIGGVSTGSVTEDVTVGEGQLYSNGQLTITDPDSGQAVFASQAETTGSNGYGTFTLDAAGNWTYTADNSQQAIQELGANQSLTDSFTAVSADGTSQLVTVTIHGSNDGAEIGGATTGTVTEDVTVGEGQLYSNGQLTIADPDSGQAVFASQAETTGSNGYGTFTLDAAGNWTYTADNSQQAIQELGANQSLTDSFTAVSADGTSQLVTVTIHGSNDGAEIGGATTGTVTEDATVGEGQLYTDGQLTITDPDSGQAVFASQAETTGSNGYGTFTLDAEGNWTYTADNSQEAIQELGVNQSLTDSFTAVSADGTTQLVTVTINGSNDGPVAYADVASGDPVNLPSGLIARYTADGTTEDAVGNNDGVLQNGASYASGMFGQAFSFDGVDDVFVAPSTGLPTGNEDRTLSVWVKPDAFTSFESFLAGYGTFGSGNSTYQLGTSGDTLFFSQWGSAVFGPDLEAGQWYNVTVTNVGNDVTLYLNGVVVATGELAINTPAGTDFLVGARPPGISIPGLLIGEVDEIQVYDHALTPQEVQTVYNLTAPYGNVLANDTDVDAGDSKAVIGVAAGTPEGDVSGQVGTEVVGTYGTLTLGADGTWSYTLNYADSDTQQLGQGEAANDIFTYTMEDGSGATSTTTLTLTVHGVNDAPVAGEVSLPQTTEDNGAVTITAAQLLAGASDADLDPLTVTSVSLAGQNPGELVNNGNGTWTYTPPQNYAGDVVFNYTVSDGALQSTSTASLHIEAVADTPTLSLGTYGFEVGDASGWTVNGAVSVQQSFTIYDPNPGTNITLLPQEGSYLTVLNTDGATQSSIETFLGLQQGALDQWAQQDSGASGYSNSLSGNATSGSAAVIQVEVSAGDTISFDWNFVASDYMPYNDYAIVTINGQIYSELSDVSALGNVSGDVTQSGWQTFTYTATESGIITIGIADVDVGDQVVDSHLVIDNLKVGVSGDTGEPIALNIASNLVDTDGSETLSILIQGLPDGATLSAGTYNAQLDGWVLTEAQLNGLTLNSPTAGEYTLTVTATSTEVSNGDTASTTGSINVTVHGENNFFAQSFASDMSLMVADTTEAPEQTSLAASSAGEAKFSTFGILRRDGDWRGHNDMATAHAIAAGAGIAAVSPHFAQAETHHAGNDHASLLLKNGGDHSWPGVSIADLTALHGVAGSGPGAHKPGPIDALQPAATGREAPSLSDIINQHFETLSSAGDSAEPETQARKPGENAHGNSDSVASVEPAESHHAPQPEATAEHHEAAPADGPAPHLGTIIDFSNLPDFHPPLHAAGATAAPIPDLKHGDFAGIVDFSRDLLPEPHAPLAPDRGSFWGEGLTMHAPVHEAVHVAVNDVVQNMAHDAEAASHHHPH
ncbi:MAG: VCBS domain-containing protein [Hyphomicrobiales bacterium]